jgi:hypothetical protein
MHKPSMILAQVIPTSTPMWAVLTDDNGEPVFHRVACLGVMEHQQVPARVVVGMISVEQHLNPADSDTHHVGYAYYGEGGPPDPSEWRIRCQKRVKELREKEAAAAQSPIIVPDKTVVDPFTN